MNAGEQLIAQGRAEALRDAVRRVLAARGVGPGEEGQARIESCVDPKVLMIWLERALVASSETEVFEG